MKDKLKMKDVVLIALLTAVYFGIYMIVMMTISLLGPFAHTISPGITSLFGGTILYFMSRKVGKLWQFTLFTAIIMGLFALMGGGYLPWLITSMVGAIVADLIASRSKKTPVARLALASGFIHLGQGLGSIIPVLFFLDSYRQEWIDRGQSPQMMDAMIKFSSGSYAILGLVLIFVMAFIGIYIGHFILKQHFEKN